MSCLALALQPIQGPDLLLQTQLWFPPVRALHACKSFRDTRQLDSLNADVAEATSDDRLGDDPLAASSGQVVVGKNHKYRVVYRLVNTVYVLAITSAEQDESINVFDCTRTVSQSVSVLVTACRGIDVTPEKLSRKYAEVYLALDIILRGVTQARLNAILRLLQSDPTALLNPIPDTLADTEGKARGSLSWNKTKRGSVERHSNVEVFSHTTFDLPEAAYDAGDEAMASFAPPPEKTTFEKPTDEIADGRDPFAASDAPLSGASDYLAGGFNRRLGVESDPLAQLAGLDAPAPVATSPSPLEGEFVEEEGFEGKYGGVDWGEGESSFVPSGGGLLGGGDDDDDLAGLLLLDQPANEDAAFGGGLDGVLGAGRQLEAALGGGVSGGGGPAPLDANIGARLIEESKRAAEAAEAAAMAARPIIIVSEEISAEFRGLALLRVGLQGAVTLRLPPGRRSARSDAEFSFRLDGSAGIKRALVKTDLVSSLGKSFFHVRAPMGLVGDFPVLKYRLQPKFTPVPLRIRFHSRRTEDSLSLMIQYVANPFLQSRLENVAFIMSLPFSPASIKLNPSASLDRYTKELKWKVPVIEPKAPPQRLRAQIPIIPDHLIYKGKELTAEEKAAEAKRKNKELSEFKVRVEFLSEGASLSGIAISPAGATDTVFNLGKSLFKTVKYMCTA